MSCHPECTFASIVSGELKRLARTCSDREGYLEAVEFFKARTSQHGYPWSLFDEGLMSSSFDDRASQQNPCVRKVVPFKIPYFHGAETCQFQKALTSNLACMRSEQGFNSVVSRMRIVVASKSTKNLFRKRYVRFSQHLSN